MQVTIPILTWRSQPSKTVKNLHVLRSKRDSHNKLVVYFTMNIYPSFMQ